MAGEDERAAGGEVDGAAGGEVADAGRSPLPAAMTVQLERVQDLRYGENPHQQAARYRVAGARSWWDEAVQHGGKELSYLNLYDTEAAWRLVHRFDGPGRRHRQARQPLWGRHRRRHHRRIRTRPTPATRSRPSAASWRPTGPCPQRWPRPWPRSSPRSSSRRRSPTTRLAVLRDQEEPPRAVRAAALRQPARPAQHRRRSAGPGRRSGLARPRGLDGHRPWRSRTRPCGGTWRSRGRCARR